MNEETFRVDTVIDRQKLIPALIDSGSEAYASVNDELVQRLGLPRIQIPKRPLQGVAATHNGSISEVTYFSIDIEGHTQERIYAYIISDQRERLILGMPWLRAEAAVYDPQLDELHIHSSGVTAKRSGWQKNFKGPRLYAVAASAMSAHIRRAKKSQNKDAVTIFAASLEDIEKTLKKKSKTPPLEKLPERYREFLELFEHHEGCQLPPYRQGIDMEIKLEHDEQGKEKEVPWGSLYGMSRDELLVLRKTLLDLLDKGFIRVSHSSAGAPVLFARKPGGGLRFCVDYRALNAVTVKDRYPLPLIKETLRQLSRARWFTKVDVRAAFHRIRMKKGEEWKTAFRTRYGLYEWMVTPFGLAGGPACFQRFVNWVLRDLLDDYVVAYVDEILIYSDGSLEDHHAKVKEVFRRLQKAGLSLDVDKCEFDVTTVKYLGYIITAGKDIRMDPAKVAAIRDWQSPKSVKGVRSFLGFANFYRDFMPQMSDLVRPLNELTKKDCIFQWTVKAEQAFQQLKQLFISEPFLMTWDPEKETRVETDASGYCLGGVLSQRKEGEEYRPVAYYSRKMTSAECNYPIHDKELLAVIAATKEWHSDLRSTKKFEVVTDHKNLEYFQKKQRLSERQVRWMEHLEGLPPFCIQHRPGKLNAASDALSRREQDIPLDAEDERLKDRELQLLKEDETLAPRAYPIPLTLAHCLAGVESQTQRRQETGPSIYTVPVTTRHEKVFEDEDLQLLWEEACTQDNEYARIKEAISSQDTTKFPASLGLQAAAQMSEAKLTLQGNPCYRDALWVPEYEPLRTQLIQRSHDSPLTGHPGRDGTLEILKRQFYWPGMSQDVRRFVRNCDACGRSKVWRTKRHGLLKPLPIPDRPWAGISADFMTHLPNSQGHEDLLVITCRLTGSVILIPLQDTTTQTVADRFLWDFCRHHGIPTSIISDRGSQWVNGFWKRLCEILNIQRKLSTTAHPQTDGGNERMNQEVLAYLRIFILYTQGDWSSHLPMAQLALNNRQGTRGISPFFATHGYHVEPILLPEMTAAQGSKAGNAENWAKKMKEAQDWISAALAAAQQRMEDNANRHRTAAEELRVGDNVWLDLRNVKTPKTCKKLDWLHRRFKITKVLGPLTYELDTPPGIHNRFHSDLLRKAAVDPFPSQQRDDARPPAIVDENGDEVYEIEDILCARTHRGQRQALVKWVGWEDPAWTHVDNLEEAEALDNWEAKYGPIRQNDGPLEHCVPNKRRR